jgi:hypothetical protein
MVSKESLEQIVENIAADLFVKMFSDTTNMSKEKQAEEAMAVLELAGYVVNSFMIQVNNILSSAAEEALNEQETPKIFLS